MLARRIQEVDNNSPLKSNFGFAFRNERTIGLYFYPENQWPGSDDQQRRYQVPAPGCGGVGVSLGILSAITRPLMFLLGSGSEYRHPEMDAQRLALKGIDQYNTGCSVNATLQCKQKGINRDAPL
jgi:hypothetical protein